MKMEILLMSQHQTSSWVGDRGDSFESNLNNGKKRWCDSIRIKLVPGNGSTYDESNTYVLERFNTTAGNPVKEILLKLNLPDHRIRKDGGEDTERLSQSNEVLKLKNFKKDATLKLFKSTNQEKYEHVGPKSQVHKMAKLTRWRNEIMLG
ncbi:hypothetical protein Tco_0963495 [Tanacetum coccineum]